MKINSSTKKLSFELNKNIPFGQKGNVSTIEESKKSAKNQTKTSRLTSEHLAGICTLNGITNPTTNESVPTSKNLNSPKFQKIKDELVALYKKKQLSREEKKRVAELEKEVQQYGVLVAKSPIIEKQKISMLAKAEPREAFLPDFSNEEQLKEAGFTQGEDHKWYHTNRDWYPDALTDKDVIYIYKRDNEGKAIDSGFGPKNEFETLYIRSEDFDKNNMKFIKHSELTPGEIISVKKCASGTFCVLPVGTKLLSSEGIVEVKPGEIVNIKEAKNSIHTSKMSDISNMYIADPLNPASKKLFIFISKYTEKEQEMDDAKKAKFQEKIFNAFNNINRGRKLYKTSSNYIEKTPETLREEYELSSQMATNLQEKYLSQIDVSNFDKALEQAKEVLSEIRNDDSLSNEQKQTAITAVMVKLLPKTNAHQHVKGSLPKDTALELAKTKNYTPEQIGELENAYKRGELGFDTLTDFNAAYNIIGRIVNTPSDYKTAIESIIRKSSEEGQLTTEIRCACDSLKTEDGEYLSLEDGTQVILDAIEEAKEKLKLEGKYVPATGFVFLAYRGKDWDKSIEVAIQQAEQAVKTATEHPEMKFGFDIAGPEDSGWGPKAFSEAIDIIKEYNKKVDNGEIEGNKIGITMHAGETPTFDGGRPGYESVKEAIEMGVDRIGHGVQAVLDDETMQMMKESGVTVEICGVCNIQSIPINTEGLAIHPIQQFIDKGIKVSLATDNDALCGTNITKEYNMFLLTGHSNFMNWNNVKQSVRDSLDAAFITDKDKSRLKDILETRINKIQKLVEED